MGNVLDQFQLLILESPFENWAEPSVQNAFAKMVELKKIGYGSCYSKGVLPVDTSDFFATHVLLCLPDQSGELQPVMGYKTITLDQCKQFNQNFPGLSLVQNAKAPQHTEVVKTIIGKCEREGGKLAYLGSWTADPAFKKGPLTHINLKDAFVAFYHLLYREQNVTDIVIGGTLRFKTEKLFAEIGHKPLSLNGEVLPNIEVAHLVKEPVLVMHSSFDKNVISLAERKWQSVWDRRALVEKTDIKRLRKAA
ncbi:hypothetical protein [Bdellovibrio sp. NC01]|uniref:hypothetical protein n=1 Tax=Bdellovibrio sp. NC01 TaxID=2220073 RepID=UPI00115BF6B2|nr:hypothetical protein [Bdellovibrio sp. NC01]QDK36370.1 hypothetical protein DOE51_01520 [Bdellovibrio sp. NC01]